MPKLKTDYNYLNLNPPFLFPSLLHYLLSLPLALSLFPSLSPSLSFFSCSFPCSDQYAALINQSIVNNRTFSIPHYHPQHQLVQDSGTTHISVIDQQGLAVAVTRSVCVRCIYMYMYMYVPLSDELHCKWRLDPTVQCQG